MTTEPSSPELTAEVDDLRTRLAEAEEALRAIRNGELDAVVVAGERGERRVYTLSGADRVYRQLIETMSEGAATLSVDRVILYCNARLAQMLGQPLDQVLGTDLRDYLPPADQSALDAVLAQVHTAPIRRETNLKASDGRLVPVYLSASRLPSEKAEIVFCLVLTDLTEQKSHEQIATAELRYHRLVEGSPDIVYTFSTKRGGVYYSSRVEQVLGHSAEYLYAHPFWWSDSVHPDDRPLIAEAIRKCDQGKLFDIEYRIHDAQGNWLWLQDRAIGRIAGDDEMLIEGIATDITARKKTEDQIKGQLAELQRWQTVTLGREGRIGALKSEVNALATRLGQTPPYGTPENGEREKTR